MEVEVEVEVGSRDVYLFEDVHSLHKDDYKCVQETVVGMWLAYNSHQVTTSYHRKHTNHTLPHTSRAASGAV